MIPHHQDSDAHSGYNRKITWIIILLLVISILAPLYLLTRYTLLESFADLERTALRHDVHRAVNTLREDLRQLETITTDYSGWDDAYRFVRDRNPEFIRTDLSDTIYRKLHLDTLVYLDEAGRPVYQKAVSADHARAVPFPADLGRHLAPDGRLARLRTPDSGISGLIPTPEGILMVAARPVLTSEFTGPVRGTLVMGRYLDGEEVQRLGEAAHLRLKITAPAAVPAGDERRVLDALKAGQTVMQPTPDGQLQGYEVIPDIYGDPGILVRVEVPRDIYAQGSRTVQYFFFWCAVLTLVAAAAIYLLLDRLFTGRRSRVELENRYRAVVANAAEGIVLADPDTLAVIEVNAAFAALLGTEERRLIGTGLRDHIPGDQPVPSPTDPQATTRLPVVLQRGDGEPVYTEMSASLIPYRDGSALSLIVHDVTERKLAEDAVRDSAEQYRVLTSTSMDGFWVVDGSARIVEANDECTRMYGYSREELLTLSIKDVEANRDPEQTRAHIEEIMRTGRAQFETRHRRKDGSIVDVEVSTSFMPERGLFLTFLRHITARKQAEERILRMNEELEQRVADRTVELEEANRALQGQIARLEQAQGEISQLNLHLMKQTTALGAANKELESFSYSVSHDLRAPLRHISGYAQALIEECADRLEGEPRVYLERLAAASCTMAELIDGLLNLSRVSREALNLSEVDLSCLYRETAEFCREECAGRPVTFAIADGIQVRADATLLRTAVRNLLGNACKYSRAVAEPRIECGVTERDGTVVHYVRDNGMGFDMRYADRLFGAFQRLHNDKDYEGSGIGLATVQRIIHRHGGTIWAEAEVGRGAAFYFTLP